MYIRCQFTRYQDTPVCSGKIDFTLNMIFVIFTGWLIDSVAALPTNRLFEKLRYVDLHFLRFEYEFGSLYVAIRLMSSK